MTLRGLNKVGNLGNKSINDLILEEVALGKGVNNTKSHARVT